MSTTVGLVHRWAARGRRHRRARVLLLSLLACLLLLGGGWLALRHSSLVSVQRVQISGVHGPEAAAIEAALAGAARRMSTLDVRAGALRAAVTPFRQVRSVSATASFPHSLKITVLEQPPVAALVVGSRRTAVAADGAVLGPALLSSSLPTLDGGAESLDGPQLRRSDLLAAAVVLGAAPGPLRKVVARAFSGPKGLTVAMRNGLEVYFGDVRRPHAKWLALVRVLSDTNAAGAAYVDVRVPERPAAGFASGTAPSSTVASSAAGSQTGESAATPEATTAAIAASLAAGAAAGAPAGREAPSSAPATGATATPGEAASSGATQGASTGPSETSSTTTTPGG